MSRANVSDTVWERKPEDIPKGYARLPWTYDADIPELTAQCTRTWQVTRWIAARCLLKKSTGCWIWQNCLNSDGYGDLNFEGRTCNAHRVMYAQYHKRVLRTDQYVMHKCNNPACCNPKHLMLGTQLDNMRMMVDLRRQQHGETHYAAKLTEAKVRSIHRFSHRGWTTRRLADRFDVHADHIRRILNGQRWRYVFQEMTVEV